MLALPLPPTVPTLVQLSCGQHMVVCLQYPAYYHTQPPHAVPHIAKSVVRRSGSVQLLYTHDQDFRTDNNKLWEMAGLHVQRWLHVAPATGLNTVNQVPEIIAETGMPITLSVMSVVDPGTHCVRRSQCWVTTLLQTQTLANVAGPGHEREALTLIGAPWTYSPTESNILFLN